MKRSPLPQRRIGLRRAGPRLSAAVRGEAAAVGCPLGVDGSDPRRPQRTTRIKPVSAKRAAEKVTYLALRTAFLTERPWCEYPGCAAQSGEIQHKRGRVGTDYLDVTLWAALCREHGQRVTEYPVEAKELGLALSRLAQR